MIGNLAEPESFRGSAEAQDGYVHAAFDSRSGRGPAIEQAALEAMIAAAQAAAHRAASTRAAKRFVIYTSGVWVLGKTPEPAAEDAPINPIAIVSCRPAHEQLVLDAAGDHLRTVVVRPGVVYGGGSGIVGDIFKSASNGLVRVDRRRQQPVAARLRPRSRRICTRGWPRSADASGIYHANDEGDERVNDIVARDQAVSAGAGPTCATCRSRKRGTKMGAYADALALDQVVRSPRARALGWTPTLHSVAGNAARLLEEWRAARNCKPVGLKSVAASGATVAAARPIRSARTPPCSGSAGSQPPRARAPAGTLDVSAGCRLRLRQLARHDRVDQSVVERVLRVEIEVGALGVA